MDKTYRASNVEEMVIAYNNCLTTKPYVIKEKEKKNKKIKVTKELELINTITTKLAGSDISDELSTLLADITDKIEKDEKVPGYLKAALEEETADYSNVQDEVTTLLDYLK